jgi:hypothetical protein
LIVAASRFCVILAAASLLAACTGRTESAGPPLGFRSLPVDTTLTALSQSHLSPEAQAALNACVRPSSADRIVGGALVPSAHDVGKYMPTNGNEPELQGDGPVWLFQLSGVFTIRFNMVDPVCMVRGSQPVWFAPYDAHGNPVTFGGMKLPTLALPPIGA